MDIYRFQSVDQVTKKAQTIGKVNIQAQSKESAISILEHSLKDIFGDRFHEAMLLGVEAVKVPEEEIEELIRQDLVEWMN